MKKIILFIIIFLITIYILSEFVGDRFIKKVVEKNISNSLDRDTKIQDLKIYYFKGEILAKDIRLNNKKFSNELLIIDNVYLKLDTLSIFTNNIILHMLHIVFVILWFKILLPPEKPIMNAIITIAIKSLLQYKTFNIEEKPLTIGKKILNKLPKKVANIVNKAVKNIYPPKWKKHTTKVINNIDNIIIIIQLPNFFKGFPLYF